ncbi:MAG: hypothetical protein AAF725_09715, partial [Acidobacteriota bacterium]
MPKDDAAAAALEALLLGDPSERASLLRGEHADPHRYLGPHRSGGSAGSAAPGEGLVVRAWQPEALSASLVLEDGEHPMRELAEGLFAVFLPGAAAELPPSYRLRFGFEEGGEWLRDDPYRFPCSLDEEALYFISEGTHRRLWEALGAHPETLDER